MRGGDELKELTYWNHNTAYYKWIKRQVSDCDSILDVGCGNGALIGFLDDGIKQFTGIDKDDFCIKTASETHSSPSVRFICCDFMDYSPEESFNAIVFVASIHHMDMLSAIKKAKSLLSPNGILLIIGLADPSTLKDYIFAGWRLLPSMIVSKLKRMRSTEELNIPVSYDIPLLNEVREIVSSELPHCSFRQGIFHRYLVKWQSG